MNTPTPDTVPSPALDLRRSRREFLREIALLPAALGAARLATPGATAAPGAAGALPQIRFGAHSLSRLVCGANPFNGGSHLSVFVNREMKQYYTPGQILKTLRRCQQVGINAWQSSGANSALYERLVAEGGQMRYISLASTAQEIDPLVKSGCIAVAHHGEVTDRLFKRGRLDDIHDFLRRVRDTGLMAGVSTHMPAVVDAVESRGWHVDFYMCCVYERHRTADELRKLLGTVPIPVGEVYLESDPPRMFKAMRQTQRPCLAFKILAAGRLSERRQWVENAFRATFEGIKPTDGVIVGIYDKFDDQPAEDADFTRRHGTGAA